VIVVSIGGAAVDVVVVVVVGLQVASHSPIVE
jgi:hypothetical protein